jgi:hypothetical protein
MGDNVGVLMAERSSEPFFFLQYPLPAVATLATPQNLCFHSNRSVINFI